MQCTLEGVSIASTASVCICMHIHSFIPTSCIMYICSMCHMSIERVGYAVVG